MERQIDKIDDIPAYFMALAEVTVNNTNSGRKLQIERLKGVFHTKRREVEYHIEAGRLDNAEALFWMARQFASDIMSGTITQYDKFIKLK